MEKENKVGLTTIENLKNIYNLDYDLILDKVLNKTNFRDLTQIVFEIIDSFKKLNKNKDKIESVYDRLIEYSLETSLNVHLLNKSTNDGKQSIIKTPVSNYDLSNCDLFLNYLRNCYANCSYQMKFILFKLYFIYFIRFINLNIKSILNLSQLPEDLVSAISDESTIADVKVNSFDFLVKFFNLITSNANNIDEMKKNNLIRYFVDISLTILYEQDNDSDPNVIKLCINTLSKLALLNEQLKCLILNKLYQKLLNNLALNDTSLTSESKKRLESFIQDSNLNLLTSLADYIVQLPSNENQVNYLNKLEYWHLIQIGLTHTNSLTRKRALYLLKRTNDLAMVNKQEINSEYFDVYESSAKVFLYEATWSIWNDYFLCIELLEESSVHIIKPSLVKVNNLIDAVKSNRFHFTWLIALFSRAFLHESKFIVRWAVSTFLQSDLHLKTTSNKEITNYSINRINSFILGPLMIILQKSHLYYRAEDTCFIENCPKIAHLLSNFIQSYLQSLPNFKQRGLFFIFIFYLKFNLISKNLIN
jgi:hypothetical protein